MVYTKHFAIHTVNKLGQLKDYVEDATKTLVDNKEKNHLENIFPYMMNDDKTLSKQLVSGYHISNIYQASDEFIDTKKLAAKARGINYIFNPKTKKLEFQMSSLEKAKNGKKAVLAHHLVQSFSPEDGLSPEEIHEIGRQTVLELTGGEYEFVVATHVDKKHIHNHLVFNSTNSISGKQFDWKITEVNGKHKDMSKKAFEEISDRIASAHGAKIIEKSPKTSHAKYTQWQTENIFKSKIKSRLDFLLEHSYDLDDFKKKADALHLHMNFSGKWATYRLLDEPQINVTRSRVMDKSKDGEKPQLNRYNLEQIVERLKINTGYFSIEDIIEKYEEKVETAKNDFDFQAVIEPWQIDHVTNKGLYLNVDFGIGQHGIVFVGGYKTDLLENGNYNLYVRRNDYFYFMDQEGAVNNRYMMGSTLIRQLSLYNGTIPVKKERVISTINELTDAINFLASRGVDQGGEQLTSLENQLIEAVNEAKDKLNELDEKIFELENLAKQIMERENSNENSKDVSDLNLEQIETQLASVKLSRSILKEKLDEIVKEINAYQEILYAANTNKGTQNNI
ncbi:relaxase/mobilization nuclease domain-containing protein [Lactococcus nasutitermitis]|uniref:Relaxase/mobilization nuclease domain-containing protein n=1 Tax=Lactococcus nasutitermitis TaxID=1652957 RepID=A0ABV9JGC3_9LACT|nr:relaxase/mobilization nuclease domain-containing protein [Lactococcus nasutitermitis]